MGTYSGFRFTLSSVHVACRSVKFIETDFSVIRTLFHLVTTHCLSVDSSLLLSLDLFASVTNSLHALFSSVSLSTVCSTPPWLEQVSMHNVNRLGIGLLKPDFLCNR